MKNCDMTLNGNILTMVRCIVLGTITAGIAQNYNISGIIIDTGATPLSGAVVLLEKAGLTAISGSDGRFTLTKTVGIKGSSVSQSSKSPVVKLHNGFLGLNLPERSVVGVSSYSIQGKLLSRIQKTMDAGVQSITVPQKGTGVYLYRVKIGEKETFDVKSVTLDGKQNQGIGNTGSGLQVNRVSGNKSEASLSAAINDVVVVTKDGFLKYRVAVTKSDTSGIEIRMIASFGTVTDADGHVYQTVRIGNQIWMAENLNYLPEVSPPTVGSKTEKHYYVWWYSGTDVAAAKATVNYKTYGVLYNWPAAKAACPAGWHLPSNVEIAALKDSLINNGFGYGGSGNDIAKSMASKTNWTDYPEAGTPGNDPASNNRSGFSALPAGDRFSNGSFYNLGGSCAWWMATEITATTVAYYGLNNNSATFLGYSGDKDLGLSVRCVKD